MEHSSHCSGSSSDGRTALPRPGRKLLIVLGIFLGVLVLSFLPVFAPLNTSLLQYLAVIWWAVLLGLLLGGVIDYFVPDGFIVAALGRHKRTALFNAVVAGLLMSACSHGILAIAIQLYKKGASVPAVITFLLASPWANVPVTILLFGLFGAQALLIVFGAMAIALVTGFIFTLLDRLGWIEGSSPGADPDIVQWHNIRNFNLSRAVKGVAAGGISLANMVLWWILIGVLLAALIGAYVPEHWFMQFLGPDLPGMLVTLVFATVLEVCSEGTSPIAFELYNNLGVLGNPFIFLMAGVATDYTEIGLLWSNIGRRTAIWLPIVTVPQIMFLGFLLNLWSS
ncbi:MAG: permease [Gammaproteobacteria bacterium]|nr:permease [Gammaproteobacteria bacterium]